MMSKHKITPLPETPLDHSMIDENTRRGWEHYEVHQESRYQFDFADTENPENLPSPNGLGRHIKEPDIQTNTRFRRNSHTLRDAEKQRS